MSTCTFCWTQAQIYSWILTYTIHYCVHVYYVHVITVGKREKIRNRYNQAPHLTKDTNGKVTTSKVDITNESQEVSTFQAGDHKASINRRAQKHNKTRQK